MSPWPREGGVTTVQDLEDLATAAWLSETLFAALELGIFEALGEDALPLSDLAARCGLDPDGCARLVDALVSLGLLTRHGGPPAGGGAASNEATAPAASTAVAPAASTAPAASGPPTAAPMMVACATVARRHLLRGAPGSLSESLAYRRKLAGTWTRLADAVRRGGSPLEPPADEDGAGYTSRVRAYVAAMDDVARHKATLIADRLDLDVLAPGCLADLGGGAGAVAAEVLRRAPAWKGVVFDMPEVVESALDLWAARLRAGSGSATASAHPFPDRLRFASCDLLAEEVPGPPDGGPGYGLVIASNVVHAYAAADAGPLLDRAVRSLSRDGLLLVHDFFTDGPGRGPVKSALFDLHMMINTYQGRTYPWGWVRERLQAHGLVVKGPIPLGARPGDEDTSLIAAARNPETLEAVRADRLETLDAAARGLGFRRTAAIAPERVVTAPWVEIKCRFGCSGYDRGAQCPPRSPRAAETREVLASYSHALLVEGEPPTADFHERLLALERAAFLGGAPRALVFVAGPCRLCPRCEPDACRRPREARPSMEASGMDVYATAEAVGWRLEPVPDRESPATYVGLLLVE